MMHEELLFNALFDYDHVGVTQLQGEELLLIYYREELLSER